MLDAENWVCGVQESIFCKKGESSPSGNTTTIQKSDPWPGQQPFLAKGYNAAGNLYDNGGPSYFPGATLAPPSQATMAGIAALTQRGASGSPLVSQASGVAQNTLAGHYLDSNPANGYYSQTARGKFLNSNPWLDQTFDLAAGKGRSALDAQFSGAGRYGSGAHEGALSGLYADLGNQIYGGNYQQERNRMLTAASGLSQNYDAERQRMQQTAGVVAPALAAQDYQDINARMQGGQAQDALSQAQINDQVQRYNYEQNLPYANLANYMQLIGSGSPGSSQTTTQPYFGGGGGTLGALGGAGLGGGAAYALGASNPYIAGAAVAGGLLGQTLFR